jgi:glycosyltransferase involved in cell wall biosynthesis
MRICFVGLDNLPVLARHYAHQTIGGESVQQTLLARALARRGYDVCMVVADHGQADGAPWDGVRTFKAYRTDAGVPVLRFIHPRWTGLWSALARADAALYYTSCAGMHVGLLALFCRQQRRRFVFRTASDSDCDPERLLVRFARDRWLYALGLRRADAILVQSAAQARTLALNYGLHGRVARMLVEPPEPARERDIDVLWLANLRLVKRPDRIVELAARLPEVRVHIAGGPLAGEEALYRDIQRAAAALPNVVFHGRVSYWDANTLYARARVLVNTSEVEGFPNAYLQAWARGTPVVTLLDPDGVVEREQLGGAVATPDQLADAVRTLLADPIGWQMASDRCRAFIAREYAEDKVLATYLETFDDVMRDDGANAQAVLAGEARRHV